MISDAGGEADVIAYVEKTKRGEWGPIGQATSPRSAAVRSHAEKQKKTSTSLTWVFFFPFPPFLASCGGLCKSSTELHATQEERDDATYEGGRGVGCG